MPRTDKAFEPARLGVFATPGSFLTQLNSGIRDKEAGSTNKRQEQRAKREEQGAGSKTQRAERENRIGFAPLGPTLGS